jgi:hypothetical protein
VNFRITHIVVIIGPVRTYMLLLAKDFSIFTGCSIPVNTGITTVGTILGNNILISI